MLDVTDPTPFTTEAVYAKIPGSNDGDNEPELSTKLARTEEAVLITVTWYTVFLARAEVFAVDIGILSWGVTTNVIVLAIPALSDTDGDVLPDVTPVVVESYCIDTVAPEEVTVGVIASVPMLLGTVIL